ncbi:hypothetical protein BKA69DRAFT_815607 [Paraphysoderma sedebokerense]|nr:hypothetical protein BKA69DRAFT_815607 [Paraphysoderma sedebokerense]
MSSASAFYDAILSSILLWSKTIVLAALLVHVPSILKALLSSPHSSSQSSNTKSQPKSLNDSQHQAISDETLPSPPPVNCSGLNINVEKNEEVTRKLEPRDSVYSENNFHVHQVRHSRPSSTNYECGDTFSSPIKESTSRLSASHQSSFSSDFEHDDNMVPLNLLTGDDFSTGDEVESHRKPELNRSRQEDNTFIIKSEPPSSASTQSSTRRSIKRKPVPSLDFFSLPPHIPKSVNESAVVASSPSVCGSIASTWVTYESDHPLDSDMESTHTSHRHQNSAVRPPKRNRPTRRPVSSSSTSSVRIPTPDSSNESNSDYSSGDVCDLSSKELTEFPLVPTNVAKLLLDYNNIYSIPSNAFQDFSNLEVLDLSSNRLPDLPDSIGSLGNLKELYLRGNLLLRLPDALERLTNLEILDVSCNELYELGPYVRTMTSLQQIDVRHNKLRTLPSELGFNSTAVGQSCCVS